MSKFRAEDGRVLQEGFLSLPKVDEVVSGSAQSKGRFDGSTSSCVSELSSHRLSLLQDGDLITGTIDISQERLHMLPAIRDDDRAAEKQALVRLTPPLLMAWFDS